MTPTVSVQPYASDSVVETANMTLAWEWERDDSAYPCDVRGCAEPSVAYIDEFTAYVCGEHR